jgi:hypothetical protein
MMINPRSPTINYRTGLALTEHQEMHLQRIEEA